MRKILVIDDEPLVRDNLAAYLEDEGYQVKTAKSAESGLVYFSSFQPDIVLVDLRLEGVSGEVFIKTAFGINPRTRYLIHTGSKEYQIPSYMRDYGVNDKHIAYKPVDDLNKLALQILDILAGQETVVLAR